MMVGRVSKKMKNVVGKMHCPVDVQPGPTIRQLYADQAAAYTQRRWAVNVFLGRSLHMSMSNFFIRSFTIHGMCIDETGTLNAMLRKSQGLEVLDMYNNHIPDNKIGDVFEAIPPSLRVLKLTRQWIHRSAVTPLCELLTRLVLLRELDLSENYLNSQGMQALTASITSPHVRHLSLRFNHLRSRFMHEYSPLGLQRFMLKELDLSHNLLQSVQGDSMYACIRNSAGLLTKLDVSFNDLRVGGVSYLSTALSHNYALRHLNVAGNLCGDAAMALIFAVIHPHMHVHDKGCLALESLHVGHNNLTCASAVVFQRTLFGNEVLQKSLSDVSFSNNDLNDRGAMLVIEALLPCDMKKIALAHCVMGETAGMCLAGTMLYWPNIADVDVHGNHLCDTSLVLMARALTENNTDTIRMQFIGNWVTKDSYTQITEILETQKDEKKITCVNHTTPVLSPV